MHLVIIAVFLTIPLVVASYAFVYLQHGMPYIEWNPIHMLQKLYAKSFYGWEFWLEYHKQITYDWWNYYMVKLFASTLIPYIIMIVLWVMTRERVLNSRLFL